MKPIEEYLTAGKSDLLPSAKKTPIGKQKIKAKAETIKVSDKPPHAPVSIHSRIYQNRNTQQSVPVSQHGSRYVDRHVLEQLSA